MVPRNGRGERVWFGLAPGNPAPAALAGSSPFPIAQDHFVYWLHQNPAFDWAHRHGVLLPSPTFTSPRCCSKMSSGPTAATLNGFIRHGTKLIGYHGWADVLIFPAGSVQLLFRASVANATAREGRGPNSPRLFMVSRNGSLRRRHGAPMRSATVFQFPQNAQHDAFIALQQWGRAWGCARAVHSNQVRQQQSSERSRIYPAAVASFPQVAALLG